MSNYDIIVKASIEIFSDSPPKNWPMQKFRPPHKIQLTQRKFWPTKKIDPRKNLLDPRNPRKEYDLRKKYFDPRNPRNRRKNFTHSTYAPTDLRNPPTYVTHVTTQPTRFSRLGH